MVDTNAKAPDAATSVTVLGRHHVVGKFGENVAVGIAERVPEAVQLATGGREDRLQRLAPVFRLLDQPRPGLRGEGEPGQIMPRNGGYRLSSGTQRKLQSVTGVRWLRTPDRLFAGLSVRASAPRQARIALFWRGRHRGGATRVRTPALRRRGGDRSAGKPEREGRIIGRRVPPTGLLTDRPSGRRNCCQPGAPMGAVTDGLDGFRERSSYDGFGGGHSHFRVIRHCPARLDMSCARALRVTVW